MAEEQDKRVIGQAAEVGEFCPIVAISKYPYKFVRDRQLGERIAQGFFNAGKFWMHRWELFYVWSTNPMTGKPLLLITKTQVDEFLATVNKEFKGSCPSLQSNKSLIMSFDSPNPDFRPRYLGISTTQEEYKDLESRCMNAEDRPSDAAVPNLPPKNAQRKQEEMIQLGFDLSSNRKGNKGARQQQQQQRHGRPFNFQTTLEQAQNLLGLRRDSESQVPTTQPAPHEFHSSPIFISIDVESYERVPSLITEIGISTLDTLDLLNSAPGDYGSEWRPLIRSRHFRIIENAHYVNNEFVQGNPGNFRFGKSEFIHLADAPSIIASCFKPPFSAGEDYIQKGSIERTLIVVGHDVANDIRYLQKLGYSVENLANLHKTHPVLDTQALYKAWKRVKDPQKLAKVLDDIQVEGWGLHNAGNDARYTMEAFIGVVVTSALEIAQVQAQAQVHW